MTKPGKNPDPAGEAAIIARIAERFGRDTGKLIVGIGDDAAVLPSVDAADAGRRLNSTCQVVTTDLLIEGVHFDRRYLSLADIGYKALAVNLSDIAAMGARPVQAFGNLGVPPAATGAEVDQLLDGVAAAAECCGVVLAGGDTVAAPQWIIGFTVIGAVTGPALLRSTARPGDLVWHSCALGLSQVGLHRLWAGDGVADPVAAAAVSAHRRPMARLELGSFLQENRLAHACIDLSDSLAQCLLQLASASGVGLTLDFSAYTFAPEVSAFCAGRRRWSKGGSAAFGVPGRFQPDGKPARYRSLAEFILAGAEDYELLFTAPPSATARLLAGSPVPLRRLGTVVAPDEGCHYRAEDGRTLPLTRIGFEHR